jgi:non-specific serine/threonine protein kinase
MLADAVSRATPELGVPATSRQALRVPGGLLFAVPPLPVPTPGAVLGAGAAIQYPALALFAERASAVGREFAIITDQPAVLSPELLLDVRPQDVLLDLAGSGHGQG